jgi:hypothetical protein
VVATCPYLAFDLRRIAQRFDLIAVALEQGLHVVADRSIVVDDKDPNSGKLNGHGILLSQGRKGVGGLQARP